MPGKWVGGKGSVASPTKDQFIEGKTVDDYGSPMGTVLLRVKRIFAPGEKGRFILGDYVSASEKRCRDWASSKAGKVTSIDGSYHLCRGGPEKCEAVGSHDIVVHLGQWRTWKEEELLAGGPDHYSREARNLVGVFFKKHDLAKGRGTDEDLPWREPGDRPRRQGVLQIGSGAPPRKPDAAKGLEDKPARGAEDKKAQMAKLKEQLRALKEELKEEAEGEGRGSKRGREKAGVEKGRPGPTKNKAKSPFDRGGLDDGKDPSEPDWDADDAVSDDEEEEEDSLEISSDDESPEERKPREEATKEKKKVGKAKAKKAGKSRGEKEKEKKKKKGRKKGVKTDRDKGPFGVGETRILPRTGSDDEESEEADSSSTGSRQSFRKAPSGLTLHLRLLRYAQRHPGRLATRLLQKMERGTRFEGAVPLHSGKKAGQVRPCAVNYLLTIQAPMLREKWNLRSQREMRVLAEVLDQLASGRGATAADIVAQRLKAVEQSVQDSNSWRKAKYLELVADEMSLTDRGEEQMMAKEVELEEKFRHRGNNPYWKADEYQPTKGKDGKGTGKRKGQGKGKTKTPAMEAAEGKPKE
eukprot:Skav212023  [mRNA]  locus=scaffold984:219319:221061:+ [translate_table: standard]